MQMLGRASLERLLDRSKKRREGSVTANLGERWVVFKKRKIKASRKLIRWIWAVVGHQQHSMIKTRSLLSSLLHPNFCEPMENAFCADVFIKLNMSFEWKTSKKAGCTACFTTCFTTTAQFAGELWRVLRGANAERLPGQRQPCLDVLVNLVYGRWPSKIIVPLMKASTHVFQFTISRFLNFFQFFFNCWFVHFTRNHGPEGGEGRYFAFYVKSYPQELSWVITRFWVIRTSRRVFSRWREHMGACIFSRRWSATCKRRKTSTVVLVAWHNTRSTSPIPVAQKAVLFDLFATAAPCTTLPYTMLRGKLLATSNCLQHTFILLKTRNEQWRGFLVTTREIRKIFFQYKPTNVEKHVFKLLQIEVTAFPDTACVES